MLQADNKARLTRQPLRCWRRWGIGWTASCCCRWRALLPQLPQWWRSCRQPAPSVQCCQGIWITAQTNILPLVQPLVSFPLWHLGFLPYLPSTFLPPPPPTSSSQPFSSQLQSLFPCSAILPLLWSHCPPDSHVAKETRQQNASYSIALLLPMEQQHEWPPADDQAIWLHAGAGKDDSIHITQIKMTV